MCRQTQTQAHWWADDDVSVRIEKKTLDTQCCRTAALKKYTCEVAEHFVSVVRRRGIETGRVPTLEHMRTLRRVRVLELWRVLHEPNIWQHTGDGGESFKIDWKSDDYNTNTVDSR